MKIKSKTLSVPSTPHSEAFILAEIINRATITDATIPLQSATDNEFLCSCKNWPIE